MSVLALIPARAGSKSIPRKNLRALFGHPLIAWSIAAARAARSVERVLVSTDDDEIRQVARGYGAEAPFLRPPELAGDETPDLPVFAHALHWLQAREGYRPALIAHLRPTSPLRPPGLVDSGVAALAADPEADSLRAVSPPAQNPYKMWRLGPRYLAPLLALADEPEPFNRPRQSLPQVLWQTGQLDVIRRETILGLGSMTGRRVLPLCVDPAHAVDIDTPEQWAFAETLLNSGQVAFVVPRPATAVRYARAR